MDFVNVLREIPKWKATNRTFVVNITSPENYMAYMVEYLPLTPRHKIDIIHKFQPLLTLTKETCFAQVLLAFQYDEKYYVLYEYFEQTSPNNIGGIDQELGKSIGRKAIEDLKKIHVQGTFHGDICEENVKTTENGIKIVGWRIPPLRTWDPEPEPDWKSLDLEAMTQTISKIYGFNFEYDFQSNFDHAVKESIRKIENNLGTLTIQEEFLQKFSEESSGQTKKTEKICEIKIAKGSTLVGFNAEIFNSGGDFQDFSFKKFKLRTKEWEIMPELLSPHKYHASIFYENEYWVLGGINSSKCEKFSDQTWQVCPDLSETHESPSCCIHNTLYLFGICIEKLVENQWVKLGIIDWIGYLGIVAENEDIFIVGGRKYSEYNSKILQFSSKTQSLVEISSFDTGIYGLFGSIYIENEFFAASNSGKIAKISLSNPNTN